MPLILAGLNSVKGLISSRYSRYGAAKALLMSFKFTQAGSCPFSVATGCQTGKKDVVVIHIVRSVVTLNTGCSQQALVTKLSDRIKKVIVLQ